jgi:type IV secretory pathway VirJ component
MNAISALLFVARLANPGRARPHKLAGLAEPGCIQTVRMGIITLLALMLSVVASAPSAQAGTTGLPVIEVPARSDTGPTAPLMILLTGDGGWAAFDREIATRLAAEGWATVGFDLRSYLWTPRTPEETAAAVDAAARRYGTEWHRSRLVLAGFSRGADLAPFVYNRLPAETRSRVEVVVLLSPGRQAEFEFHLGDFLRKPDPASLRPVREEVERFGREPLLVLRGRDDRDAIDLPRPADTTHIFTLPGDHHLGRDYPTIISLIRAAAHER